MFFALRDLRFARGRFVLVGSVVAMITLLVVFLSGLTAGLGRSSTSSIAGLPAERIVFGGPPGAAATVSFSQSTIGAQQLARWSAAPGVQSVYPLGVGMTRLSGHGSGAAVSVFGAPSPVLPPLISGSDPSTPGQVLLPAPLAAEDGVVVGSQVELGGVAATVSGITQDRSYGHAPTVWTSLDTWRAVVGPPPGSEQAATVLVVGSGSVAGIDQAAATTGTLAVAPSAAFAGIDGYSAEHGSLLLIQVFLLAVSALVIGAFFTVWTMQRKPDVAVLKAIGGSNGYLMRDALLQALLVLCVGSALGGGLAVLSGAVAGRSVPFVVSGTTTLLPMAAMVLLGAVGAALAIRRITAVDPLTALGGTR